MARDYGVQLKCWLAGDATAAAGIARRRGAGKVRHIETRTLWLQRKITNKEIELRRIPGKEIVAEIGTKHLAAREMHTILAELGFEYRTGRSEKALRAALS